MWCVVGVPHGVACVVCSMCCVCGMTAGAGAGVVLFRVLDVVRVYVRE